LIWEERTELLRYFEIRRQCYVSRSGRLGKRSLLPGDDADSFALIALQINLKS